MSSALSNIVSVDEGPKLFSTTRKKTRRMRSQTKSMTRTLKETELLTTKKEGDDHSSDNHDDHSATSVRSLEDGEVNHAPPPPRKIPKTQRFNYGDHLEGDLYNKVTLVHEPTPLDFADGNGDTSVYISRSVMLTFFQRLSAWRRNKNNSGKDGTVYRNTVFLSTDVQGWLSNMAGDPHANPSRTVVSE